MANKVDILNYATGGVLRTDDYPADKQWQLVGQRCGQNGQLANVGTTQSNGNFRLNNYSQHYIPSGASALQLIYSGMYLQASTPGEMPILPNVFEASKILSMTGGTGYIVGEILTFPNWLNAADGVKVMIMSVSSTGVPLTAKIINGGIYPKPFNTPTGATVNVTSVTMGAYSGGVYLVTVVTETEHNYSTGAPVFIEGASPAGYNGARQVTVVNSTTYTFPLASSLTSPATGTITSTNVIKQSSSTGSGNGAIFTFDWDGYAAIGYIGIEPDATNHKDTFLGQYAVVNVKKGFKADGIINRKIKIPMGGIWESDIIPIDVPIGGKIGLRGTWIGGVLPTGRIPNNIGHGASADNEEAFKGNTWFDQSNNGVQQLGEAGAAYLFQPAAIMGIPKKKIPTIMAIGDSRTVGSGSGVGTYPPFDSVDSYGNVGCFERALSQDFGCFYPWTNHSRGGIALAHYFGTSVQNLSGHQNLIDLVAKIKPTAVYLYLCTNDIFTGQPFATVQQREQQLIAELKGCGVKYVFTSTMEPQTTSTDSWATLENQTLKSVPQEAVRVLRNDGLIAGTYAQYDFFVDNRLVAEPSINNGKWIVNGTTNYATGDGIHASHEIHRQQAIGIANAIKANLPVNG